MLTILIIDDDEEVRRKAMRALAGADVRLASAADGAMGLQQAALLRPDIVICDIDLPVMGGFDVLAALKANTKLASLQVMMLTAHTSRHSLRLGMSLGADDYLTKPFTDEELVAAVEGLMRRRGRLEVLRGSARPERPAVPEHVPTQVDGTRTLAIGHELGDAVVLFADIQEFTAIAEKLPSGDVARLLAEYFDRACDRMLVHGGRHLKLMGDGLLAVFVEEVTPVRNASERALLAADAMGGVSREIAAWVTSTLPDASLLPPFRVGLGLHRGEVFLSTEDQGGHAVATPIGPTVQLAARLVQVGRERDWAVVATDAVVACAPEFARLGEKEVVALEDGTRMLVHQIAPHADLRWDTMALQRTVPFGRDGIPMRDIAREHAGLAATAVKEALGQKLAALRVAEDDVRGARLHGFRIVRRLAEGGMATVYLAVREASEDLVVLKILPLETANGDLSARFIREFSLLSRITHPNVVRIFGQGFGEKLAYIAMEYFENGDLRARIKAPFPPREVIAIGTQIAAALAATHAVGIVHRDLKPENLMVRADGQVVLADFGIAKLIEASAGAQNITRTGELMGSPMYMSPEQILGQTVTHRSDLYALGVVLYELCTGRPPYQARTLVDLLNLHTQAPPPVLPPESALLQPVIHRLLAKEPEARFSTARQAETALRLLARRSGEPAA